MKTRFLTWLIVLLFVSSFDAIGQQNDFVTMPQIKVVKKLNSTWYSEFFQQLMLSDNSRELWMSSTDMGIGFRLNRNWSIEVHNRLVHFKKPSNVVEWRNLIYQTIQWQEGYGKWTFSLRNRVQQLSFVEHWNDAQKQPRWYNRIRMNVSRRFDYYWSVSGNVELFNPLNHVTRKGLDQYRAGVMLARRFNERFTVMTSYQVQQLLQRRQNNRFWVLGLQIVYEL